MHILDKFIILCLIMGGFLAWWYLGGRDFVKKFHMFNRSLPKLALFECTFEECQMLSAIISQSTLLQAKKDQAIDYISYIIFTKNGSEGHRVLQGLVDKEYVVKIQPSLLFELEKMIIEINRKRVHMSKGYSYYLVGSKFSKMLCGIPTRENDFKDVYNEF